MHKHVVSLCRALVVFSLVATLAVPAQAQPTDEGWSPRKLMKVIKRFVVKTFGDGLIVPRP